MAHFTIKLKFENLVCFFILSNSFEILFLATLGTVKQFNNVKTSHSNKQNNIYLDL